MELWYERHLGHMSEDDSPRTSFFSSTRTSDSVRQLTIIMKAKEIDNDHKQVIFMLLRRKTPRRLLTLLHGMVVVSDDIHHGSQGQLGSASAVFLLQRYAGSLTSDPNSDPTLLCLHKASSIRRTCIHVSFMHVRDDD